MYTIGIDLGGTNIAIGLCDKDFNIIDKDSIPTKSNREPDEIVADMARLAEKIIKRNHLTTSDIACVGIASPGSIIPETGCVERSYNLPFQDYPIAEVFRRFLPIEEIYVENDANAAVLGEAFCGAGKGHKSIIMVTIGTGIGVGVVIDGIIFSGSLNHSGAEIGHMVILSGGRECTCGRRGCFEAYSSASALTAMTKEKMQELEESGVDSLLFNVAEKEGKVSARTAFDAMRSGDPYGKELVDNYIYFLAEGITNIVNIFQPEVICIGGGVSAEKDNLVVPLTEIVNKDQYTRRNLIKTKICTATLGNDAGIVGAALLKTQNYHKKSNII